MLGGGMGALTAALELSEGDWTERFERIAVYQRGWRLGGKGASSRGVHGRIEEHGLHVLLGYYDHTFAVMRRCYEELDRSTSDPNCPIRTWDEAVAPSNLAGVVDRCPDGWAPWVASFGATRGIPGRRGRWSGRRRSRRRSWSSARSGSWWTSSGPCRGRPPTCRWCTAEFLTGTAAQGRVFGGRSGGFGRPGRWACRSDPSVELGAAAHRALPGPSVGSRSGPDPARHRRAVARRGSRRGPLGCRGPAHLPVDRTGDGQSCRHFADGLLARGDGFAAIDHLDYRAWLSTHGIDPGALNRRSCEACTTSSSATRRRSRPPPIQRRPRPPTGHEDAPRLLGSPVLENAGRDGRGDLLAALPGAAGPGGRVPLLPPGRQPPVTDDGRAVASIELGVQTELGDGVDDYDPLIDVKGLPCWPGGPLRPQLRGPDAVDGLDLESFWSPGRDSSRRTL